MASKKAVDEYIDNSELWRDELNKLRKILTTAGLDETIKWGGPCYTHGGRNVVGLAAFKSYFGLWFFQGAMLSDPDKVLVNAQTGKTKAMRQWRFTSADQIEVGTVRAYVREAIANAAAGREIRPDRDKPLVVPAALSAALSDHAGARAAFTKLTRGRQREYAEYVASAKRAATKASRIEKILPMIEAGRGLHDKYR